MPEIGREERPLDDPLRQADDPTVATCYALSPENRGLSEASSRHTLPPAGLERPPYDPVIDGHVTVFFQQAAESGCLASGAGRAPVVMP